MRDASLPKSESVETLLGQAADEFTERIAAGTPADVEEFAARYPEIAAVIRQVFPALRVLHQPAASEPAVSVPAPDEFVRPWQLGDYRIVREIGRGGMGIVYEAEQISLGRRVALKILPFAAVLDARQLERFKREAQAAAQLHHTHIVPVFSVGSEHGVHYYAMQYIDGRPLSAVIQELRDFAGLGPMDEPTVTERTSAVSRALIAGDGLPAPSSRPRTGSDAQAPSALPSSGSSATPAFYRSVAYLGVQAAEALQHAHESGIIHRDIKPANLLLDTQGHLWMTDFGLAMIRNDPGLTLSGDVLGTLRYMSPEQALSRRAGVDHRTDIYSLGVTLYELFALERAYPGRDRPELLRQIAQQDPRPLRSVRRAIPRELETIVAKAIDKNPERRYATAGEFAADLRRFLDDRPILARPPTVLDRAAKWARRHRTLVSATAVLLFMAVVGLAVSTVLIARERAEAIREWGRAEANLQVARDSYDRMLTRVPTDELGAEAQVDRVRQALLDDGGDSSNAELAQKSPRDLLQAAVGRAFTRVAHINALLSQDTQAIAAYERAIDAYTQLSEDFPEISAHHDGLAATQLALATLLWERGRSAEAELPTRQALVALKRVPADPVCSAAHQQVVARTYNLLGLVLRDLGRFDEAEAAFVECLSQRVELVANSSGAPQPRLELARALRNHADLQLRTGRPTDAEATVNEVVTLQKALVAENPSEMTYGAELAQTHRWWSEVRRHGSGPHSSGPDRPRDSPELHKLVAELPELPWYREQLARAYSRLDRALINAGCRAEADDAHQQAVLLQEQLVAGFPAEPRYRADLVELHRLHATSLKFEWRFSDAEQVFRRAIALQDRLVADFPTNARYRTTRDELQWQFVDMLDKVAVEKLITLGKRSPAGVAEAVALARAANLDEVPLKPFSLLVYGEYLALGGDFQRAAKLIRRGIDTGPVAPSSYKSLGWALLGCGRPVEARAAFEKAIAHIPSRSPTVLMSQCPDPTTAAYFLGLITSEQYTEHWQDVVLMGARFAPFPWFYVGLRHELAGELAAARSAYRQCVERGRLPGAHLTANWAAYRLQQMDEQNKQDTASSPASTAAGRGP